MPASKAPLGLAGFLALPVFFASLMAASLAIEKPRVVEWTRPRGTSRARATTRPARPRRKIWLLALVPPLLLVLAGWIAAYLPFGIYVTCVAACVDALALTVRLHTWELHHTARFGNGEDILADQSTSSSLARGEWEHDAAQTVRSLVHYTIGLAITAALIALFLRYRRRSGPVTTSHSELQQTGGAPTRAALASSSSSRRALRTREPGSAAADPVELERAAELPRASTTRRATSEPRSRILLAGDDRAPPPR